MIRALIFYILFLGHLYAQTCSEISDNLSGQYQECNGNPVEICQGFNYFVMHVNFSGLRKQVHWEIAIRDTNGAYPSSFFPTVTSGNSILGIRSGFPYIMSTSSGTSSDSTPSRCGQPSFSNGILTGFSFYMTAYNTPVCITYVIRWTDHPSLAAHPLYDPTTRTCTFTKCYTPCRAFSIQDPITVSNYDTAHVNYEYIPYNFLGQKATPLTYKRRKDGVLIRVITIE